MATFRFTLTTPGGSRTFGADKVRNWPEIAPAFVLNTTYRGLFRDFTSTFEFTGSVRRSIITAFDQYGYDVEIFLTIEAGNDNGEFSSFKQLEYRLKADINEIEITDLVVSLNFADTGFVANVMNRDEVKVNLHNPESGIIQSIDGSNVKSVGKLLWKTWLHDRRLIFNSKLIESDTTGNIGKVATDINYVIQMNIDYESDNNVQNTYPEDSLLVSGDDFPNSFYLNSDKDRTINIDLNTTIEYRTNSDSYPIKWTPYFIVQSADNTTVRVIEIEGYSSDSNGGPNPDMTATTAEGIIQYNDKIKVLEGESIILVIRGTMYGGPTGIPYNYIVNVKELKMSLQSIEEFTYTEADLILPHDLFSLILKYYTGQELPFYSEFFGRKDLGYNENGPGATVAVATGKMIRGFPYGKNETDTGTVETYFNTSFKEAFEAYNKIFNLAATVENIGNEQRIRIEPIEYFRNYEIVADIGTNFNEINRKIDTARLYSDIKVGYQNKEYEELNGLFSFNGEFGFSSPLQTATGSLDLINTWRADDIGIEITRRQQYKDDPSKDYRSDNDIFFVDCKLVATVSETETFWDLIVKMPFEHDTYETVEGIFEPALAYNLNISPKRCFLNWQKEIKSALGFKPNDKIKYIQGAKNAGLVTKKTNESEVVEAGDVVINTLSNPDFIPEIIQISEAVLTSDQWESIKNNRFGVIAFEHKGVKLYGFINDMEFEINRKIANFELLRANL